MQERMRLGSEVRDKLKVLVSGQAPCDSSRNPSWSLRLLRHTARMFIQSVLLALVPNHFCRMYCRIDHGR